ncbi:MAG: DUF1206 domain-containing protein, partial [Gammaproteobacteria bacterium]
IILFGLWQFYRAATRDMSRRLDLTRTRFRMAIGALGVYGLAARGVLFGLIGLYLLYAAWHRDPRYAGGIASALDALQHRPYGKWLLGAVAIGLVSYGSFQIVKARYLRLPDG